MLLYACGRVQPRALAVHMRLCQEGNRIRHDEADAQKQEATDDDEKVQNCQQQHLAVVILTCLKALLHGITNAIAIGREPLHQREEWLDKEANQRNHSHDTEHAHDGGERFFIGKLLGIAGQPSAEPRTATKEISPPQGR